MSLDLKSSIHSVFKSLNDYIVDTNQQRSAEGTILIPPQKIQIVGQMALLMADLPFPITSTTDLDMIQLPQYEVKAKLEDLLIELGLHVESDSHLIWMPQETEYLQLFEFSNLLIEVAKPEFVIASKAKFMREKDKKLLETYHKFFNKKS